MPITISDKIDRTLLNLKRKNPKLGHAILITKDDVNISFSGDISELQYTLSALKEKSYIDNNYTPSIVVGGNIKNYVKISPSGWEKISELEQGVNKDKRQGFVAMWFDSSMQSASKEIHRAISDCQFEPKQIDKAEHNNDINDEIIAEIKNSRFIVGDFTGNRGGVYYEAGFARALGLEVIHTCKDEKEWKEKLHFDIEHRNFIFWKDEQDLYIKLKNRIRATI